MGSQSKRVAGTVRIGVCCIGVAACVLLILALSTPLPHTSTAASTLPTTTSSAKIDPVLLKVLEAGGWAPAIIIVHGQADLQSSRVLNGVARRQAVVAALRSYSSAAQADLLTRLAIEQNHGRVRQVNSLWIINAIALTATRDMFLELARRHDVDVILADQRRQWLDAGPTPMQLWSNEDLASSLVASTMAADKAGESLPWNITQIGAHLAWQNLGIDGSGVVVASMDTGVDVTHHALMARYRGYNNGALRHQGNWFVTTGEDYPSPADGHGHGTHTTGIMVGSGVHRIGVAPGAQWIAVKVLHDDGSGYDSEIHAGFQWLLAPDGDPALAPQIVNCSWGNPDAARDIFRRDVAALRAAGIFPVFAAGNNGSSGPGSIGSPASYPEAFAVGASDQNDLVAIFSGRGPSPWGEVKPQVVAPGIQVLSALPGGRYDRWDGTSMAAPHVAGVAALLLQADPSLTLPDLEYAITSTARPLGTPIPSNAWGWGRLDAYAAIASVMSPGIIQGTVVGGPNLAAALIVAEHKDGRRAQTTAAADGTFSMMLAAGSYTVTVSAFGHVPGAKTLTITANQTIRVAFDLQPLPQTPVSGKVYDAVTGVPLLATVEVLNTPVRTTTGQSGEFHLMLPAGRYVLQATSERHRRVSVAVAVSVGEGRPVLLALPPAPSLLVINSGAWYSQDTTAHLATLLDELNYVYARFPILDPLTPPTLADLRPYDVVIWDAPRDSPGYIQAERAISEYLRLGGRLLLMGQDVAYWDGGGSTLTLASPYFTDQVGASYIADSSEMTHVVGIAGTPASGLALTINHSDSAANQTSPDVVTATEALPMLSYLDDGVAGTLSLACRPYRAAYVGFGLEGAGPQAARLELLRRLIDWMTSPTATTAATLVADSGLQFGQPGETLAYPVTLRNLGTVTASYDIDLFGNIWPAHLEDGETSGRPLMSLVLPPCQQRTFTVRVTVPLTATPNISDSVSVRARSQMPLSQPLTITLTAKTPSGILLVDDGRWYDVRPAYEQALAALGLPYDVWNMRERGGPDLTTLRAFPVVIWFTGYNWFDPLTVRDQETLHRYVQGGGRLFLSGQDILENLHPSAALADTLGVISYTADVTVTAISGIVGDPIGGGLGTFTLSYPFTNFSDFITPAAHASVSFIGNGVAPTAVTHRQAVTRTLDGRAVTTGDITGRSVFFAFPFEALARHDAQVIMGRIVRWLHPLGDSGLEASAGSALRGQIVTYTIVIRNSGPTPRNVAMFNLIPALASYVPGSVTGGAIYDAQANSIVWPLPQHRSEYATPDVSPEARNEGLAPLNYAPVEPGEVLTIAFAVRLQWNVPPQSVTTNTVHIQDQDGTVLKYQRRTEIAAPDLSLSALEVDKQTAQWHDTLTYSLTLRNRGTYPADVTVTDMLPEGADLVAGSATADSGVVIEAGDRVVWRTFLHIGASACLTVAVRLNTPLTNGMPLVNRASIDDGWHEPYVWTVTTTFQAPDLAQSRLESSPRWAPAGSAFRYVYVLTNSGVLTATPTALAAPLPDHVTYQGGDVTGGGYYDPATGGLRWTGSIAPGRTLTMTIEVWVDPAYHGVITNTATLDDGMHPPLELQTQTIVPLRRWFFPLVW